MKRERIEKKADGKSGLRITATMEGCAMNGINMTDNLKLSHNAYKAIKKKTGMEDMGGGMTEVSEG